jgi:hypothetical protein
MSLANRIVFLQGIIGLLCLIVFLWVDVDEGLAVLMAMVTTLLPSAYYAWFQQRTLNATRLLLHGIYRAMATVALMVIGLVVIKVAPLGFLVSFALMQFAYLAGLTMREERSAR